MPHLLKRTQYLLIFFLLLFVTTEACNAQNKNFSYKTIPADFITASKDLRVFTRTAKQITATAFDLIHSLPDGYVRDGSVDYTDYIQKGISEHDKIVFPDFPILINKKGLSLISNSIVVFRKNSKLILDSNNAAVYKIISLNSVKNVTVYFPAIIGDRKIHTGNKGESGMGIFIVKSENIQIINPIVKQCWGDGIYVGGHSINVIINYAELDFNRRNGISVTSVNGLKLIKPRITNTYGTSPMSGIDIEPNSNDDIIDSIQIDSPLTFNNGVFGIIISLGALHGQVSKDVNITIKNHIDYESDFGLGILLGKRSQENATVPLHGKIEIDNATWKGNIRQGFLNYKNPGNTLNVVFKNISIVKQNNIPDVNGLNEIKKSFNPEEKVSIQ